MSGMTEKDLESAAVQAPHKAKRAPFLRREMPTILAICGLLALWFGLVAGG